MAAKRPDDPASYDQAVLSAVDYRLPDTSWEETPVVLRRGSFLHPAKPKHAAYLSLPASRPFTPTDADWKLPDDWQGIIARGLRERVDKYRSLRVFMDSCVRCGACADKCHFYLGTGDPKNMPVLRAELLRSVYRHGAPR